MKVAFYTLGCKVNQYESQIIAQQFAAAGFEAVPWPGPAEVYVVNSCSVTAQSEKKAAQLLRRLQREHPEALLALCGCWPQAFPEQAAATGAHVVAGTARSRLPLLVAQALQSGEHFLRLFPPSLLFFLETEVIIGQELL